MRSPEELDTLDWASLTHAYGPAEDVPEQVRSLYSDDPEEVDEALYELYGNVWHQGSVYPASVEAVPFLAHAAVNARFKPAWVLMLLSEMAAHEAPDGSVEQRVRAQVAAVVPDLLPCLRDPDRAVRRAAVRVAVAETSPSPQVVEELLRLLRQDPVAEVRADALTALARTDPDPTALAAREADALGSGDPVLRREAALLGLERLGQGPYPPHLVRILAEAEADSGEDGFPFPGLGTGDERVSAVLDTDADTALTVARHWIAQGDVAARGSFRADRIACDWRDREHDVVALLVEALPLLDDPQHLALRLEAIARWLPKAAEPDAALRDTLLRHATGAHERAATAARLALARCGDDRFLQQPALRDAETRHLGELLSALTAQDAASLLPELKDLLRTRRAPVLVARRLGDWGVHDQELLDLLTEASTGSDELLGVNAAVALVRLGGGDPAEPLELLRRRLESGKQVHWYLDECGRLADRGLPLVPRIEELCHSSHSWTRMAAAEAHWRITGDPARATPILVALADATPVGLRALLALAEIGATIPEQLRPRLRHWAFSPRRLLATHWPPDLPHPDDQLRDTCLQLLSR
ncbi:HEAT repeat domain-containing protein [Streptacidiphilus sp. N1-12]|uniref:HEAT repeat domain-containing protein n=2 Tax=Streptacidiphilus alkalitolerans TaxID=3342712 RepID=A0ABV6WG41_9ACTN